MRVRQRLRINTVVMVVSVIAVLVVLFAAVYRIIRAAEATKVADEIITGTLERVTLRTDYLRTGSERARDQVRAKHEKIGKLLKSASVRFTGSEDKKTIEALMKGHESIGKNFRAIVENRKITGPHDRSAELSAEIEDRLLSQLNMRVYETVLLGGWLQKSSEEALVSAIRLAGGGIAFVLLLAGTVSLINSRIMDRAITDRIQKLRDGAVVIGGGDLNHRIDLAGDDEFSDLSATFNTMTAKLRVSYEDLANKIEERKRAEEALLREKQFFESLFHNIPGPAYVFGEDGRFVRWNRYYQAALGYSPEDMAKLSVLESVAPSDRKKVASEIERVFREGYGAIELQVLTVDGKEIPFYCMGACMVIENTRYVIGVGIDVTERKKAEAGILKLNEDMAARNIELEFLNKELEAFIYSISHDLRAPIRSMANFAKFLVEDYSDKLDKQGHDYLTRINRGAETMTRLIEDLLRLSKISRQEIIPAMIDLSKMASSIAEGLRETNPERNVAFSIQQGLTADADPRLMEIALSNLLGNAWKFTSKKEKAHIDFISFQQDGKTVYCVRDDGAGFDQDHVEKIFWPFQRLHADIEFEGIGIGLSIVERIIHRHGGRIWAEGDVGKGATIYFTLK